MNGQISPNVQLSARIGASRPGVHVFTCVILNERLFSFSFQRFSSRTVRVAAVPPGRHDAGGQEAFPAAVLLAGESK